MSAGKSGSRRRHESWRDLPPTDGGIVRLILGRTVVVMASAVPPCPGSDHPPTRDATLWQLLNAPSMDDRPAITAEQPKTLKCAECGAMNYPTEWYCERCGAELAAL